MSTIKEKAQAQALRHCQEIWDESDWSDILEKYAETSNKARVELQRLTERQERGARIEEEDWADYHYYNKCYQLLACWIANDELTRNEYERDKNNRWILKNQPPAPPAKKKFGFWK